MSINNKKSVYKIFSYLLVCVLMSIIACDTSGSKKELPAGKTQLKKELSISDTQKVPKLYLIGGVGKSDSPNKDDVWSSEDGENWTQVRSDGEKFTNRWGHQLVVFRNKMYLIGGYDNESKNDVWSSSNGMTWEEETASAKFSARYGHQVVVFKGKMYVIGGYNDDGYKNDVWSSSNGMTWKEETASATFSPRFDHQVVVFKDTIYLIAGMTNRGSIGDIWNSENGKDWEKATENIDSSFARSKHQVVVFQENMYLISGFGSDNNHEVWNTSDGIDWVKVDTIGDIFSKGSGGHQVVVFQDKMYLIGGRRRRGGRGNEYRNDVWSTTDGVTWIKETASAIFSARYWHQVVLFPAEVK